MSYRKIRTEPIIVVEVTDDYGLHYSSFATYEEALEYVKTLNCKSCIIGSDFIEDHT